MFDPHMTDAWKKINPISDTKEMTDLFYEMTKEFFDDIEFGNQTYMNVYLKRSDKLMNKKDFVDSLRGFVIEDEPDWEDYTEESGSIKFSCDPDPYGQPKEWNVWSSPWIDIHPDKGALCVFPSTMRNRLTANQSEVSRKELMFHFVPK